MAIQVPFIPSTGIFCPVAYARVASGVWDKDSGLVSVEVQIFADADKRKAENDPIAVCNISFPLDLKDTANIMVQSYNALKKRTEFGNAVDV